MGVTHLPRERKRMPRVMTRTTVEDVPNQPRTPQRSVRIVDDLWLPLKALAEAQGVTASDIVRQAIEDVLLDARS